MLRPRLDRLIADEPLLRREFWRKLRLSLSQVPFAEDLVAAWFCATDRATPAHVKATLIGAVAYFIVPTDMVPDFVAGLGFTDDATVLLMALRAIGRHLTPHHRDRARAVLARTEPLDERDGGDEDPFSGNGRPA